MAFALHAGTTMSERERLDVLLYERGLAPSRARAQSLIRDGRVTANGVIVTRPGLLVEASTELAISEGTAPDFASRGGKKLDPALDSFGVSLDGAVVVDVGASTGGFTDAALRRGARKVYAVDVGHDQLAPALRADARVVVRERTNARELTAADFDDPVDVIVVDASFISLTKLSDAFARILRPGGTLVALVKPQFEVGPELARKHRGVIRDPGDRRRAIESVRSDLTSKGFEVLNGTDSTVPGPKGNVEHFLHALRR
jgi:23S rRNA (cytidine1920-2'-O)/16S rRNA (cytidine1409-2'-O)-methyltransferase